MFKRPFLISSLRALLLAGLSLPALALRAQDRPWKPPVPPGARDRAEQRHGMVTEQIAEPRDGRMPIADKKVLEAMRTVPRHAFVPEAMSRHAYRDGPLPIGHGQTISQPYIVAMMTELLGLSENSKVLEIGTGSGYQAAVLAQLTPHVYSIEIVKPLAEKADEALREQGYSGVQRRQGDGYFGWKEAAPFDAIIVTCAAGHTPAPLWDQLKTGGRLVIPVGGPFEVQRLVVLEKTPEGRRKSRTITEVRFVPMTGEASKKP